MKTEPISENKHKELLERLNPLIDHLILNGYHYFLVAGKDGVCTRHMRGESDDIEGMITTMMIDNNNVSKVIKNAVIDYEMELKAKNKSNDETI